MKYLESKLLTLGNNSAATGRLSNGAQQAKAAEMAAKLSKDCFEADKKYFEDKAKKELEWIEKLVCEAYDKGYEDGYNDAL